MGIGNSNHSPATSLKLSYSLPLMGIGNPGVRNYKGVPILLITPHGDRKLGDLLGTYVQSGTSLPLMGIGNVSFNDWPGRTHADSLPLMGIGNLNPSWEIVNWYVCVLITPHGDRKPSRAATPPKSWDAHYPSWGSETAHSMQTSPASLSSHYPSWGSETPRSAAQGRYVCDSLPLMGIGNAGAAELRRMGAIHLITPHGDRKPSPVSSSIPPCK